MSRLIALILEWSVTAVLGRILLTLPFWFSAASKLIDFQAGIAEMEALGLNPPWLFNAILIAVQFAAVILIIANRLVWLAAGALGVLLLSTIPIAHRFWALSGQEALDQAVLAIEHIGLVGGFVLVAVLAHRPRTK